jgi:3-dehydroquinate synthase
LIARSCALKASIVERDEREETGLRAVLNYGHTFAHAFETVSEYSGWLHGEAVAAGMVCAARLARIRGLVSPDLESRQQRLLESFKLPSATQRWPAADLLAAMRRDKKALAGRLRLILPTRLGEAKLFDDVSEAEVRAVLDQL